MVSLSSFLTSMDKRARTILAAGAILVLVALVAVAASAALGTGFLAGTVAATGPWNVTGNAGTDPTTNFVGTTDGQPLIFKTGNTERLRIDAAGKVGIGTTSPGAPLEVSDAGSGGTPLIRLSNPSVYNELGINATGGEVGTRTNHQFQIKTSNTARVTVDPSGNVGIGTTGPSAPLEVTRVNDGGSIFRISSAGGNGFDFARNNGTGVLSIQGNQTGYNNIVLAPTSGNVGIGTLAPQATLDVSGTARVSVLQITGGSDLAEPFEMAGDSAPKPGMVVAIDPQHPGQLRLADKAYDRTVAGIVSGANGINPGLTMKQERSVGEGSFPVALSGRVYVWADASNGPIGPGDLLTTSGTAGHAMKVTDYARAQGAILGKAMSSLQEGTGLILVLVSLQ